MCIWYIIYPRGEWGSHLGGLDQEEKNMNGDKLGKLKDKKTEV